MVEALIKLLQLDSGHYQMLVDLVSGVFQVEVRKLGFVSDRNKKTEIL